MNWGGDSTKCGALTSMARMLQKPLTCFVPLYWDNSNPVLRWTQSELPKLDWMVRKITRKYQCHHYNNAIERVNLPRSQGGRGLRRFSIGSWKGCCESGKILPMIHSQLLWLNTKSGWSAQSRTVLKEARLILGSHGIEVELEMWLKTDPSPNSVREWRRVALELREAPTERLKVS